MMKTKCITPELLADYIEGRLPQIKRDRIEHHLLTCESCLESVSVCGSLVHGEVDEAIGDVPDRLTRQAVSSVLSLDKKNFADIAKCSLSNLMKTGRSLWDNLEIEIFGAPAYVRSGETDLENGLVVIKKEFEDLNAKIEFEKTGEDLTNITVYIHKKVKQKAPVRVAIFNGEREVASVILRNGVAHFEDISFGSYCLIFSCQSEFIGKYPFKLSGDKRG